MLAASKCVNKVNGRRGFITAYAYKIAKTMMPKISG